MSSKLSVNYFTFFTVIYEVLPPGHLVRIIFNALDNLLNKFFWFSNKHEERTLLVIDLFNWGTSRLLETMNTATE